ncbi:DnaQ-like DNA polymerase III subunit [Gordonia phage EMoore]|uniref:DnaQ-like DNA polymerase III subunit n=1 Tax=Gordonia phage EMoore TaxID=2656534 RepID=A0A649VTE8_9CAUD|nr:DnaQ-like DNA polymerase III subunit [Gordonia phage EMoore]QGJ95860.1 DnaQ-like DNA polymerase III subunit [Gordonia phage EMoore]
MTLTDMPLAAFDLETTSPDPFTARIVTASIIRIHNDTVLRSEWLLDPGIEIPDGAAEIHGVTTERARAEGTDYRTGVDEIVTDLAALWEDGHLLAIMNAPYDLTLLLTECDRLETATPTIGPVIDPLVVDKHLDRYRKGGRTLTDLAQAYRVEQDDAHQSTGDCLTTARIAYRMLRHGEIAQLDDPATLMRLQASWRGQQQDSLRAFWQGRGDPRWQEVNSDWPVQLREATS